MQTPGLVYSGSNNNTLSIFVAPQQPPTGSAQAANWLPALATLFYLELRLYQPESQVLAGQYIPPAVLRNGVTS